MKLEFLFTPTSDLKASLALYRDSLGFTEVWREGDATVALALPGTEVQLMLDAHDPDAPGRTAVRRRQRRGLPYRPPRRRSSWSMSPRRSPAASWPPTRTRAGRPSTSWTSRQTRTLRKE